MIGSFSALKASRIRPSTTARLIAPTTTGLRSRNGVLIGVPAALFGGGAERGRGRTGFPREGMRSAFAWGAMSGGSSQIAPARAGVVADGDGGLTDPDLAGEVAEVEVEPRAVDRGAAHLGQLDRQHLQGAVDLGTTLV